MHTYIDSHVHLWKLKRADYGWLKPSSGLLYRDYEMKDLEPLLIEHHIEGVIVVQAAPSLQETKYLLTLTQRHQKLLGVVGWVDLASEDAEVSIDWLADQSKLSGIRLDNRFLQSYKGGKRELVLKRLERVVNQGLTIDWLISPEMMEVLLECLDQFPGQTAVVNHIGGPPMNNEGFATWKAHMEQLSSSRLANVKLSGMLTQGNRMDVNRHAPYVATLCELFGADRLLFGSDWPVALNGGSYSDTIACLERWLPEAWGASQRDAVRRLNARRIYKIAQ